MFGYLLARLWKNPLSRIGFLAAVALISFGLIFSARQSLYKFFSRAFSSPDWNDVSRHGSRPFAFEENENKARDLTENAWREIYALAHEKLHPHADKTDPVVSAPVQKPFSAFLRKEAEEEIFTFLNGLHANCGGRMVSTLLSDRQNAMGDLAQSKTIAAKLHHQLIPTVKQLLRIQATQVEAALQKKPDFIPAIDLSYEVFRAACSIREIPPLLARALDYREYFLQKNIYGSDNGKLYEKNPELFQIKSAEAYSADKTYRDLSIRYFETTRFRTPYDPAHLRNIRNTYATIQSPRTLESLIAALLAEARNANPVIARKCHAELYALDFPGITDRPDYLQALSETAVLAEDYNRAENVIGNALKSAAFKDESTRKELLRLRFHLQLIRHESENLSRF